jgi:hypothetical protein
VKPGAACLAVAFAGLAAACGGPREAGGAAGGGGTPAATPAAAGWFEDVTAASGIAFRHVNGATGQKYMPETLGSGVCVFDADGDGRQDIFFVQSGPLPGFNAARPPASALYRNLGGGRFADVTDAAGVGATGRYGFGCTAGDIDDDGDRDLYVTAYGANLLYRNDGRGVFTDVTAAAGVGSPLWSAGAGFADADGDGDLDLYVANYVDYDVADNLYCGENRPGWRTVCHPRNFDALPDILYRNRGDGTFEDATAAAGMTESSGKGLGIVWGDIDDDGDEDLYVANDDTPNFLWRNRGGGVFDEVGMRAGVALSEDGVPQAGMGTDMGDSDNDGRIDLFVTNLSEETNDLYRNTGDGGFEGRTYTSGLGAASLLDLGFGTFFFDPDHDGDPDLFVANGHIIDNIALYNDTITFEQPMKIYVNQGDGRFRTLPPGEAGAPFAGRYVGRGAVPFDLEDDGDLDIVVTQNDRPAIVLRNRGPAGRHWLSITLAGARPNRDAIGAVVTLAAGGVRQMRVARTACSYLSQADRRIHFGLGDRTAVGSLVVRWPGRRGFREEFAVPGVDRFLVLEQGTGRRLQGSEE